MTDVLLETIVNAIQDGILLLRDGRVQQANDRLCEMTGLAPAELHGAQAPFPFVPHESVGALAELLTELSRDGWATGELVLQRYDGTRFPALVTLGTALSTAADDVGQVLTVKDISERKAYEAELQRLASHDPLTGLLNHRTFHEHLAGEVARAQRHGRPLSLVVLDLDHFKAVNDRLGHLIGDEVLREVAERLQGQTRRGEHVARVGGEEFAWILPDCRADGARIAAERARKVIADLPFPTAGSQTISAGAVELTDGMDAGALYTAADEALYRAKGAGRNCVAGPLSYAV